MRNLAKAIVLIAAVACVTAPAADASCQGRKTTGTVLGAAGGGVLGNVITHGSAIGTVAGVVGGGLVGHEVAKGGCSRRVAYYHHRRYWIDRHGHRHYYRVARR
ncbi:MAG: glycine zipper 2TM domain-containing protein [Alphaproteobacteria bacterium]|nr:glycine zipper 2TM domain-containing protein [Alphaproteobacteria bacterium]